MRPEPIKPGPLQESVWDYPRPPRLERVTERIRIVFRGQTIADTTGAYRVLETSHPPTYYLPPDAFVAGVLEPALHGSSFCEWKGRAKYFHILGGGQRVEQVAWSYPEPTPPFAPIAGFVAVYAGPMDGCYVGDERVMPQPGGFYGGWITARQVGPFKGTPGSAGW